MGAWVPGNEPYQYGSLGMRLTNNHVERGYSLVWLMW